MTAVVDELAALLAAHEDPRGWTDDPDGGGSGDLVYECNCGDLSPVLADQWIGQADVDAAAQWHRRHLAGVIAEHFAAVTAERDAAVTDELRAALDTQPTATEKPS